MPEVIEPTPSQAVGKPPAVRVSLTGVRGRSRHFCLDLADWEVISRDLGEHWTLVRTAGRDYVTTSRPSALRAARAAGMPRANSLILARFIARAMHDGRPVRIFYLDGDTTNLRRANLTLTPPERVISREPVTVEQLDE